MAILKFSGKYRWLSNFWYVNIYIQGTMYLSVEHAYQVAKTDDQIMRQKILQATTAGEAKRLGLKCKLRPAWEEMKVDVMKELLVEKFKDTDLRMRLLDTEDLELIEGNDWGDVFWGVCGGTGKNMLGKLLMEIRREIRDGV